MAKWNLTFDSKPAYSFINSHALLCCVMLSTTLSDVDISAKVKINSDDIGEDILFGSKVVTEDKLATLNIAFLVL